MWRQAVLYILGVAVVALPIVALRLHTSGYCWEQGRFLSDNEKIRAVVQRVAVGHRRHFFNVQTASGIELRSVEYEYAPSVDAFLAENPDCCQFGAPFDGDAPPPSSSMVSRLFGSPTQIVSIKYTKKQIGGVYSASGFAEGQYRVVERPAWEQYKVSACGKVSR